MDLGLRGRVALVAASSQGLGYGVAHALASEGARVSLCSIDEDGIHAAAARIHEEMGSETLSTFCDVRDIAQIQAWVDKTVAAWGVVDALFLNAGGPPAGAFKQVTEDQWQAAFELTLMSAVRMIRLALPHMSRGGAILASTSSSVQQPIDSLVLSNVMRAGVASLIKTLANELASDGIRLNTLIPGRFDTERVRQLDEIRAAREGVSFEEIRQRSLATIPLKRLGTVEEYGAAAAFLLSPAASYITGATLRVDGGMIRSI